MYILVDVLAYLQRLGVSEGLSRCAELTGETQDERGNTYACLS